LKEIKAVVGEEVNRSKRIYLQMFSGYIQGLKTCFLKENVKLSSQFYTVN